MRHTKSELDDEWYKLPSERRKSKSPRRSVKKPIIEEPEVPSSRTQHEKSPRVHWADEFPSYNSLGEYPEYNEPTDEAAVQRLISSFGGMTPKQGRIRRTGKVGDDGIVAMTEDIEQGTLGYMTQYTDAAFNDAKDRRKTKSTLKQTMLQHQERDRQDARRTQFATDMNRLAHEFADRQADRTARSNLAESSMSYRAKDNDSQRAHEREMYRLSNFRNFSDTKEQVLENAHRRSMERLDHTDLRKMRHLEHVDLEKHQKGEQLRAKREYLLELFGFEYNDMFDVDTPQISPQTVRPDIRWNSYIYSYMVTGVTKLDHRNAEKSYILFTNGKRINLPKWSDGYVLRYTRVHPRIYVIDLFHFPKDMMDSRGPRWNDDSSDDDDCCAYFGKCNVA